MRPGVRQYHACIVSLIDSGPYSLSPLEVSLEPRACVEDALLPKHKKLARIASAMDHLVRSQALRGDKEAVVDEAAASQHPSEDWKVSLDLHLESVLQVGLQRPCMGSDGGDSFLSCSIGGVAPTLCGSGSPWMTTSAICMLSRDNASVTRFSDEVPLAAKGSDRSHPVVNSEHTRLSPRWSCVSKEISSPWSPPSSVSGGASPLLLVNAL